jgi:hypothetical protein
VALISTVCFEEVVLRCLIQPYPKNGTYATKSATAVTPVKKCVVEKILDGDDVLTPLLLLSFGGPPGAGDAVGGS